MRPVATLSAIVLGLMLAGGAQAATALPDLPDEALVRRALETHPDLQAARAGLLVGEATERQLRAGPHEWTLNAGQARRRADDGSGRQHYQEWELGLERGLRLPGKAEIDARLGEHARRTAAVNLEDARHEAARDLLRLWYGWLRERAGAELLAQQAASLAEEARTVARRVALGDAAQLEQLQIDAAAAQAGALAQQARGKADAAAALLHAQYPELAAADAGVLPDPDTLPDGPDTTDVDGQHALRLARLAAEQALLEARRADAERVPDPTIGVRYARERSGEESVLGVYLSLPLPGEARRAGAAQAAASASQAEARAAALRRKVEAEWKALRVQATAAREHWRLARDSATRLADAAGKLERARSLGEADLASVLAARRQAREAELAAVTARVDALEAARRLALDGHQLWDWEEEENPGTPAASVAP